MSLWLSSAFPVLLLLHEVGSLILVTGFANVVKIHVHSADLGVALSVEEINCFCHYWESWHLGY